ncbi:formate dehydrogenase accessory sulfurtransferase FdhD [Vibrio mediterranei]
MAIEPLYEIDVFPDTAICDVVRYRSTKLAYSESDRVIQETPVAIEFNGIAYTVMMCTPTHLEEFAVGFAFTSRIIERFSDIHDIDITLGDKGITLHIEVANRCLRNLKDKQRSLAGVTGCGICGSEKLDTVCQLLPTLAVTSKFNINALSCALTELNEMQILKHQTGASHAASYCDAKGGVITIFEDVGRHIALDKLIGYIVRNRCQGGAVIVTSRASYEMVQKVILSGIEYLFAMSAPTQMAVNLAKSSRLTLGGFCREGRAEIYTMTERVVGQLE